jgi:hypothetical protein
MGKIVTTFAHNATFPPRISKFSPIFLILWGFVFFCVVG